MKHTRENFTIELFYIQFLPLDLFYLNLTQWTAQKHLNSLVILSPHVPMEGWVKCLSPQNTLECQG